MYNCKIWFHIDSNIRLLLLLCALDAPAKIRDHVLDALEGLGGRVLAASDLLLLYLFILE